MKRDAIPDGARTAPVLPREVLIQGVSVDVREAAHPRILDGVDLRVEASSLTALLGPSGAGKTTLLRALAGLVRPSAGTISAGRDVWCDVSKNVFRPVEERHLGMVFQSYALWPHMSVGQNIAFPMRVRGMPQRVIDERVGTALEMVRLSRAKTKAMPSQLSGGEQQRVGLARALVYEPSVLLLDEPLANLDAVSREEIRDEIRSLQQRLCITAVYVTHDQTEALAIADRIVLMAGGRVVEAGSPREIHQRPKTAFSARFFGARIELQGRFNAQSSTMEFDTGVAIPVGHVALSQSQPATLLLRPEDISVKEPDRQALAWRGRIASTLFTGNKTRCAIDTALGEIRVDLPSTDRPAVGNHVQLDVNVGSGSVFPMHDTLHVRAVGA